MMSLQDFEPHFIELTFGKWAELLVQFQERERLIHRYEVELGEERVRKIRSEEGVPPNTNISNSNAPATASTPGPRSQKDGPTPPKRMNVNINIAAGPSVEELAQPVSQQQLQSYVGKKLIWKGTLEWTEKRGYPVGGAQVKTPRQLASSAFVNVANSVPVLTGDNWPGKLIMQLIPKSVIGMLGANFLVRDVKTVHFSFQSGDILNSLTRLMDSGYGGVVHFIRGEGDPEMHIKVLILMYSRERRSYFGLIPNDQIGFVAHTREVILKQKAAMSISNVGDSVKH